MTSNNKTNRTVGKNMDRIMELLSKLRFYGMLETYRNDCRTTSSDGMTNDEFLKWLLAYIIHSGFISGYQNRYGDNLKPPTNVYHRMTA